MVGVEEVWPRGRFMNCNDGDLLGFLVELFVMFWSFWDFVVLLVAVNDLTVQDGGWVSKK